MIYPKINSLFMRDGKDRKGQFIDGLYSSPIFSTIEKWVVQEKIDGTNIRIMFDKGTGKILFKGRQDDSQIPPLLNTHLVEHFTLERLSKFLDDFHVGSNYVVLFGEGFGGNIQTAGKFYADKPSFTLFNISLDGKWSRMADVERAASILSVKFPPIIGIMDIPEVVAFVKSRPLSRCSEKEQVIEGVVCRPICQLFDDNYLPIMFKLKVKDMEKGFVRLVDNE